jgi:hypothetical protein
MEEEAWATLETFKTDLWLTLARAAAVAANVE